MTRLSLATFLLSCLLPVGLFAQEPAVAPPKPAKAEQKASSVKWLADAKAVRDQAKEAKKPVLWVVMKDEEIACERMLEQVYSDPDIIKQTESFLVLPCSIYDHKEVEVERDGKKIKSCPHFPGVTCQQHQRNEFARRALYETRDRTVAPGHIIVAGDGRVLARRDYELDKEKLSKLFASALKKIAPVAAAPVSSDGDEAAAPKPEDEVVAPEAVLSAEEERLINLIIKAPSKEKPELATDFLETATDAGLVRFVAMIADKEVKPDKMRAELVRRAGYEKFSRAAKSFIPLLKDKSKLVRNATVVTLEEMKSSEAALPLLALWETDKNKEIRKDILRALGETAANESAARELLLKQLTKGKGNHKVAAAMGLGRMLPSNEEVRKALKKSHKKGGRGDQRRAVYYAYWLSKHNDFVDDTDLFKKRERNAEMKELADLVKVSLGGKVDEEANNRGGGGRRGRGGRGGRGRGGAWRIYRLWAPLFADDLFQRNAIKDMLERFGRGRGR